MRESDSMDVTVLLKAWRNGSETAGQEVMSAVYQQLRQLARACLSNERDASSLQPTALVNELYLALFSGRAVDCEDRIHFLNIAARQMRNLVIDDARRRKNLKRGGAVQKLTLDEGHDRAITVDAQLADLDEALTRLEAMDQRSAKVVELRFFGGLSEQEIATLLDVSVPTVKRDWAFARSWLLAQLER